MKPRIYTDTSVLGGCDDEEFREPSRRFVNLKQIHADNAVNLKRGYPLLEIRTPREVPGDE